jgi:predicted amidophosphoribosyltransferase
VWSAAPYEGVGRDLIAALKFGARLSLAERAAAAIAARAPPELLDGTVVPVPPAPWRHRWRGFDPAEAIARALAAETGLAFRPCLRRNQARRQVGRPRSERLSRPPQVRVAAMPPERAILVDDVVTTGATLAACAAALRSAGAQRVVALTFARSGG